MSAAQLDVIAQWWPSHCTSLPNGPRHLAADPGGIYQFARGGEIQDEIASINRRAAANHQDAQGELVERWLGRRRSLRGAAPI